ncbi:MAG: hypothetical protein O3C43_23660 [Verrucomicrobia bacterium]|nr:hypothetical protein [Verrucomicrobiota bacterium]
MRRDVSASLDMRRDVSASCKYDETGGVPEELQFRISGLIL